MTEYKYTVIDDGGRVSQREFDDFADALAYAKNGLVTFIVETPIVDGEPDEEAEETVWTWDDTWDDAAAIRQVAERHLTEGVDGCDDIHITIGKEGIEVDHNRSRFFEKGDERAAKEFAKAFLGDDFEAFDCDFDGESRECGECDAEDRGVEPKEESEDAEEAVPEVEDDISDEEFAEQLSRGIAAKRKLKESPAQEKKRILSEDPDWDSMDREEFLKAFGEKIEADVRSGRLKK